MQVFSTLMGVSFRPAEAREIVRGLLKTDAEYLRLEREPTNEYDPNAVKVILYDTHIGYCARANNFEISQALDVGIVPGIILVELHPTKPTMLIEWNDED